MTSLSSAPGSQQASPWVGSGQHVGPSVPLRVESLMTTSFLFSHLRSGDTKLILNILVPLLYETGSRAWNSTDSSH